MVSCQYSFILTNPRYSLICFIKGHNQDRAPIQLTFRAFLEKKSNTKNIGKEQIQVIFMVCCEAHILRHPDEDKIPFIFVL